jgi:hypothetical protein
MEVSQIWESSEDDHTHSVILIKNIAHKTTVPEFMRFLTEHGFPLSTERITLVHIPCSRKRRNARGFAVVHCATPQVADDLTNYFHGRKFDRHRTFKVEAADPLMTVLDCCTASPEYQPIKVSS